MREKGKRESVDQVVRTKREIELRGCEGVERLNDNGLSKNAFRPRLGKKPYVCVLIFKARKLAITIDPLALPCLSPNVQFADHARHSKPATRLGIASDKKFLVFGSCFSDPDSPRIS